MDLDRRTLFGGSAQLSRKAAFRDCTRILSRTTCGRRRCSGCLDTRVCRFLCQSARAVGAYPNSASPGQAWPIRPLQRTIGFLDPSAQASAPGWPLRNLLAYLRAVHPEATQTVRVLCWRGDAQSSRFGVLRGGPTSSEKPNAVGWEKNIQGKLGARVADLAPIMDPTRSVFVVLWGRT
jgi:hypothetical protein